MLFQDEFSLSNTATLSSVWSPKGQQPLSVCKQARRERVTGSGSVNYLTGQLTVTFASRGNCKTFKKHLRKVLREYNGKAKIIMYVDNVRYHHARALKPFLAAHPQIELRFLPTYSPDLNPMERVWWFMRKHITHNRYLSSLKERIAKFWRLLSFATKPNPKIIEVCVTHF